MNTTPAPTPYVEFFVPGRAAPGGSKTARYNPVTGGTHCSPASKYTKPWMALVQDRAIEAMGTKELVGGPLLLWVEFLMARPKSHYIGGKLERGLKSTSPRFHESQPDWVKVVRSTEDAMTGIVWHDDSSVAVANISKVYANPGQIPGAHVKVYLIH